MAGLPAAVASLPSFPTAGEIALSLRQSLTALKTLNTNFNPGSLTATYLEAIAIALGSDASKLAGSSTEGAFEILATIMRAAYIATASDFYLDLKCADVGVLRKAATLAAVLVIFVDTSPAPVGGAPIPAGAVVSSEPADPTQGPIMFVTLADVTIPQAEINSAPVSALAINGGSAGNVPANSITAVLSGATAMTCYNPAPAAGGTDQEGDDTPNGGLRARGLAAIPNASQCTVAALANAALSYNGITSASAVGNIANDGVTFLRGNVLVYCDDGSGNLGSANNANHASLQLFQTDLNAGKWRAAGETVTAIGSLLLATSVALTISVATSYTLLGYTTLSVAAAVQAAIFTFIAGLPLGAPVVLASIIETAKAVAGVSNVSIASVTINGAAIDLIALPQQVARCVNGLGDITVTATTTTAYN